MAFSGKQKKTQNAIMLNSHENYSYMCLTCIFIAKFGDMEFPFFFLLAGHVSELLFVVYNATIRDQAWCTGLQYFYHLRLFRGAANWQPF